MVLPDRLGKLTGRTASADGGARSAVRAGRVMTHPDQLAVPASTPYSRTRSINRVRRACLMHVPLVAPSREPASESTTALEIPTYVELRSMATMSTRRRAHRRAWLGMRIWRHRCVGRPRDCEAISYCLSASVRVPSSGHPIAAASHRPLSGPEEEHGRRESAAGAGRSLRTVGGVPKQHRAPVVVRARRSPVRRAEADLEYVSK